LIEGAFWGEGAPLHTFYNTGNIFCDICRNLRAGIKHIVIFLTVIFTITLVPFNALHHHDEDEHTAALLSHHKEHSCELDERFCQDAFTGTCEHGSHISPEHVKCFSCQFHFIKTFSAAAVFQTNVPAGDSFAYFTAPVSIVSTGVNSINNRGPPMG
jgi:hypothetical protein